MKQQTAVEWLIEQLRNNQNIRWRGTPFFELSEQAKEMEKEKMIDFARNIIIDATCSFEGYVTTEKDIEQYYNETYGGNK